MTEPTPSKPTRLNLKTYLAMVENAPGTNMFRHFYLKNPYGAEFDAIGDGDNACAFFVSSVLTIFQKINRVHGTVNSTVKDLEESGWQKVADQKPGDVILWQPKVFADGPHGHIGFYVGDNQAVSTSTATRQVARHDLNFDTERRPIIATYRRNDWG